MQKTWQEYIPEAIKLTNAIGVSLTNGCYFFCQDRLFVAANDNGNVYITYNGQAVFDTRNFEELHTFIEGAWQQDFDYHLNRL